jgi:hypothetical protein
MTVEQSGVIDIISIPPNSEIANLIISDHLPWDDTVPDHLLLLQNKINEYVGFIESKSLYEARPDLKEKHLIIKIVNKYPYSNEAEKFLRQAGFFLANAGYALSFE